MLFRSADNPDARAADDGVHGPERRDDRLLPADRVVRNPHPQPSDEILRQIPVMLETPALITGHNNYKEVMLAFYALLGIEDRGNPPVRYVRTTFLTCDVATFDGFKSANQYLSNMVSAIRSFLMRQHLSFFFISKNATGP